jgi:hypothetical protein
MRWSCVVVDRPIGASADHDEVAVPSSNANTTPATRADALVPAVAGGRGFRAAAGVCKLWSTLWVVI